jgi:GntR family transcriptional repressor for pyruvate dehydrogenase complex
VIGRVGLYVARHRDRLPVGTPRVSLVATVVERIRDYIEQHSLKPGDALPSELKWTESLAVSRPVVREAVGRLRSLGLLTVSRGRGGGLAVGGEDAILSGAQAIRAAMAVSPKTVEQVLEFRAALEVHAARLATATVQDEHFAELETLAAAIERPGMTREERVQADFAFHRRIVEITDNPLILSVWVVSQEMVAGGIRENWRRSRTKRIDSHQAHRRIISALRSRDPDAAQQAMLRHIRTEQDQKTNSASKPRGRRSAKSRG